MLCYVSCIFRFCFVPELLPISVCMTERVVSAGKSTVLCLMERFYDVAAGSVTIDGMDIRTIDPRWLHRNIVIVPQEPVLFSGSIFSNIA